MQYNDVYICIYNTYNNIYLFLHTPKRSITHDTDFARPVLSSIAEKKPCYTLRRTGLKCWEGGHLVDDGGELAIPVINV